MGIKCREFIRRIKIDIYSSKGYVTETGVSRFVYLFNTVEYNYGKENEKAQDLRLIE